MKKTVRIFLLMIKRLKLSFLLSVVCAAAGFGLFFAGRPLADNTLMGEVSVGIIDSDNSFLSERLKNYLSDILGVECVEEGKKALSDKLINTDISAIIEIPQGFEERLFDGEEVKLCSTTLDDYENGAYIGLYLDGFVNSAAAAAKGSGGDFEAFKAILDKPFAAELNAEKIAVDTDWQEANYTGFGFAIGFLVMLAGGVGLFITFAVHDDIDLGTFSRMRISRVTGANYMVGMVSASIILNLIVMLPLTIWLLSSRRLPDTNAFLAILMIVIFSAFLSAFSVLTAIVIKSKQAISVLSGGIISIGCLLGGVWFPIDDSIGAVKYAAYLTPHYWFMEEFREPVAMNSEGIIPIVMVSLATILLFLISAAIFSRKQSVN